jgi:serine/threonine protein kinase
MPLAIRSMSDIQLPISDDLLMKIVKDIANGLQAAHMKNYFHRDISPNNILEINIDNTSRRDISDWGIVRSWGTPTKNRTASNSIIWHT